MKRLIYFCLTFLFLMLWSSCRKDFVFQPSTGGLTFSKDTVYLDTVFSNIGSSTYTLKVYNNSDNDISIPTINLENGTDSGYRLNVDGIAGNQFDNIELLANDSLFVFIETTIDYNTFTNPNGEYLYTDKLLFDSGSNQQDVDLVTLVKDAVFIYPNKDDATGIIETLTLTSNGEQIETELQGRELLPDELTFTNEKPYVIYGYAGVPNGETLTIDAGARLHFHSNSGIIVSENASIHVNGALSTDQELLENEVIFEGDRLEPIFSDVPGQWGTIWLFDNSTDNNFNFATIKNATVAILSDGNPNETIPKLTLTNTQIYNSSAYGVFGRNTSITAENLVINNSGQISFAGTLGGTYNITHSTITNYWANSSREYSSLLFNNFLINDDNTAIISDLTANISNSIIYGNYNPEIFLDEIEDASVAFNFKFTNCLIRFDNTNNNFTGANYNFDDTSKYQGNIFNANPNFKDTDSNDLRIGENSAGINEGDSSFANTVPQDILGTNRTSTPDLGAYQHIIFE